MKHIITQKQSLLEKMDKFGVGVSIRYNKQSFHQTSCGGFITIAIWGFILYNAIVISTELAQQNTPSVIQMINYVSQQKNVTLQPNKFTLALGLQDQNYVHFIDETIYTIYARESVQVRFEKQDGNTDFQLVYREIKMVPCTKEHFQIEGNSEFFLKQPFKYMYCISLDQQFPAIQGEFSEQRFSQFEIFFKQCDDTVLNNKCASPDILKEKLRKTTLGSYISDFQVKITDRDNPFISNGRNLFWSTGAGMEKDIWLSLINTKIESDYGRIFKTEDIKENLVYSSNREIVLPQTDTMLFYLTILYEKNKEQVYTRDYIKVNNAFSQVGGLFNFLFFLGYAICRPFSQLSLNQKLINEIFSFRKKKNNKGETKQIIDRPSIVINDSNNVNNNEIQIKEHQNQSYSRERGEEVQANNKFLLSKQNEELTSPKSPPNFISSNIILTSNNINFMSNQQQSQVINLRQEEQSSPPHIDSDQPQQKDKKKNKKSSSIKTIISNQSVNQKQYLQPVKDKSMKINLWEYCLSYFRIFKCFQSPKEKIAQFGTESILRHIDLFNIIRKLIELEKLKRLFLNENQRKLFEYLPKPNLYIDDFKDCENEEQFIDQQEEINQIVGLLCVDYNEQDRIQQVEEAYKKLKYQQDNPSALDEKLIQMLDNQIKKKVDDEEQLSIKNQLIQEKSKPQIIPFLKENSQDPSIKNQTKIESKYSNQPKIPSKFKISLQREFENETDQRENAENIEDQNNSVLESCFVNSFNIQEQDSPNRLKQKHKDSQTTQFENINDMSPSKTQATSAMLIPQSVQFNNTLTNNQKQNQLKKIHYQSSQTISMENILSSMIELPQTNINFKKN